MNDIILSGIYIYPVKSLRGIPVDNAALSTRGFKHDRRWMLVDKDYNFITQRQYPIMSQVDVYLENNTIRLEAPGMESLNIPIETDIGNEIQVKVWNDVVTALHPEVAYDQWFSRYLGVTCHLVFMHDESKRYVDTEYAISSSDIVSFADGFPFLLISEASLQDLNKRLVDNGAEPVDMIRFRPNLQVSGCTPYAEDSWNRIKIGNAVFDVVKPCSRCIIPTINLETGEKGKEPLRTLREYRSRDNKIYFGQNLVHAVNNLGDMPALKTGNTVNILS
jgi:uncharacterized protein YcbX